MDRVTLAPLTGGSGIALTAARPGPDLAAAGWSEVEYAASGTHPAPFTTRVVVRRPESAPASGTLVVEWLNVSSGADAAPDWTYLAEELVRQGHAWAGVSAQFNGVEGGAAVVAVEGAALQGLKGVDPARYGGLAHPGDLYAHDVFIGVARAVAAEVAADLVLAVGESQSAYLLTTHLNEVHPRERFFDGYLVHSRGDVAAPPGEAGRGIDLLAARASGVPTPIRDDLDVPVIVLQTEGDLLGRMNYVAARQPDGPLLRVWEVAGAAHADLFQIGEFEAFLGCPDPVNRGQQVYVARAALRHLVAWARGGPAAPSAAPIEIRDGAFVRDDVGNVRGGVRTPVVDAAVEVLAGDAPGGSVICGLFGRTLALPADELRRRWASQEDYAASYTAATEAAIAAGFVLAEDREAVLAEMRAL
ncbi:MAG TPA: alpha/beta hydrolase domain-containing protein [Nocardioides sp.]|nr:alpha/beta hydrolase domain-containing protein [Nocardioides sp.]